MPTCATIELEKASLGEWSNGVVGKPTTKRVSLLWAYGKTSQDYEVTTCHSQEEELD